MERHKFAVIVMMAALLTLWRFPLAPAAAQDDDDPASKRVSLEFDNQTMVDALKLLFKSVGANYVLDPTVTRGASNVRVTLSIANQPFVQALESVLNAGSAGGTGLTWRLENGIYTITAKNGPAAPAPAPAPAPKLPRVPGAKISAASKSRVTLALQQRSFDDALRMLFDSADVQFVMPLHAPVSGNVTMSMTNMPFEGALLGVLKAVDLGVPLGWQDVGGGIFAIVPLQGGRAVNPDSARLSLNLNQAGLREALTGVFRAGGATYTIDQGVRDTPVTLKLNDVTVKSAAEMLLRAGGNPNFIMVSEGGTYRVGVKR